MTEIYIIRHGEAEGNVFRRFHGQYESLLTPRGHLQVACVAKRFENIHIDACYSSDMTRTSLTARSIYVPKGLPLIRDPRFKESHVGIWEDVPFGWLHRFCPEEMDKFIHNPYTYRCEGGESFDEYTQRFYEGVVDAAMAHDGGTIAIFAHGTVIRGFLLRQFFTGRAKEIPYCDNTGVCRIFYDRGEFRYDYVNDNSHLPYELSTLALQSWWRENGRMGEADCWFLPFEAGTKFPSGMKLPEMDSEGIAFTAMLHDTPVGVISLGRPEGETGQILGMALPAELDGRMYGDQLLGNAFSHFRRLGCRRIAMEPGWYPDDVLNRYGFTEEGRSRSIDVHAFDWTK